MKKCSKCGVEKELGEFRTSKLGKNGLRSNCKKCDKNYRTTHRGGISNANKTWWRKLDKNEREKRYAQRREWSRSKRMECFNHYGPCICCGESNLDFLTIDHKNNNGAEFRREYISKQKHGGGSTLTYHWLIKNNFPEDVQSLCYNCNCAKQFSGLGFCPHQRTDGSGYHVVQPLRL